MELILYNSGYMRIYLFYHTKESRELMYLCYILI